MTLIRIVHTLASASRHIGLFLIVLLLPSVSVVTNSARVSSDQSTTNVFSLLPPSDFVANVNAKTFPMDAFEDLDDAANKAKAFGVPSPSTIIEAWSFSKTNSDDDDEEGEALALIQGEFDAPVVLKKWMEHFVQTAPSNEAALHVVRYKNVPIYVEGDRPLQNPESELQRGAAAPVANNVVASGSLRSVKAAIDAANGGPHISESLVQLATLTGTEAMAFAGKPLQGVLKILMLGKKIDDDFSENLLKVKRVRGSFTPSGKELVANVTIDCTSVAQAKVLSSKKNWDTMLDESVEVGTTDSQVRLSFTTDPKK